MICTSLNFVFRSPDCLLSISAGIMILFYGCTYGCKLIAAHPVQQLLVQSTGTPTGDPL